MRRAKNLGGMEGAWIVIFIICDCPILGSEVLGVRKWNAMTSAPHSAPTFPQQPEARGCGASAQCGGVGLG